MKYKRGDRVLEATTGVVGVVRRCLWLVDLTTDAPAEAAYIVRFTDGREKQCVAADLA